MRHSPQFLVRQKLNLIRLRAEIASHLGVSQVEYSREPGDIADRGSEGAQAELSFTISSKDFSTLREIDEALKRIHNGRYGMCEATGELIPEERLEALPFARYSIRAAKASERRVKARQPYGIEDRDEE
jgi:RNA polymerase-binding transcription factor DksA